MNFNNQLVVITGGTSGIGLSAAALFGSLGANVAICGTNPQKLKNALSLLSETNISAYGAICDVSNTSQIFDFADRAEEHCGKNISVWVSNAGIYPQYNIIDTPEDVWERVIDVNMKSVYLGGRIAYAKMRKKGGVLINASSFSSIMPNVGSGVYGATKAAINSMTKTLAAELAPYGIRVCGYAAGRIDTDMTKTAVKSMNADEMLKAIPLKRFGSPEEVARGIAFLASSEASYITGSTLVINGGKYCVQNPLRAWEDAGI